MEKKISIQGNYYGHDELVDSDIASKIIGFAPRTVRDMATKRKLPIYKVGRVIRFKVVDMVVWAEEHRIDLAE